MPELTPSFLAEASPPLSRPIRISASLGIVVACLGCLVSEAAVAQAPVWTPPGFPGWTTARRHFSFSGITFDLDYRNWGYGSQIETLIDCTNNQFYCLSSPTFSVVVPRYCADLRVGHWSMGDVRTEVVLRLSGPLPIHSAASGTTLFLGHGDRPHQLFVYDPNLGLTGLYWDSRNQIDFMAMALDGRLESWLQDPGNSEIRQRVYFPRTTFDRVGSCR